MGHWPPVRVRGEQCHQILRADVCCYPHAGWVDEPNLGSPLGFRVVRAGPGVVQRLLRVQKHTRPALGLQ
eukprot:11227624-Lingulodinium_polyedra.AAC.1